MAKHSGGKQISLEQLRKKTDIRSLGFSTTEDLQPLQEFIGQKRAVSAISFGLEVESKGYNIFVLGNPGSGRTTYSLERLRSAAAKRAAPDDWVYVYNFDDPGQPLAINLPAGKGKALGAAFDELLEELKISISKAFEKSQYEDAKAQLVKEFQEEVNQLMEEVKAWAAEKEFSLKRTPQGFVNIPLTEEEGENGEKMKREIQQEEFEALSDEDQKSWQKKSEEVSQKTLDTLRKIRDLEKGLKERIVKLEAEICRNAITPYLQDVKEKFGTTEILCSWIDALTEDIIDNFSIFVAAAKDENADIDFTRYTVNVFVCNDPEHGSPVIWETNPTYYNLSGKVEYESRQGYLYTDFRKIVPGAFQKANGGFLVLDAEKVLLNFMSWEALKRVLRTGEANIENLGEQYGAVPVSSLRPQPLPIRLKVVMVGTPYLYALLQYYDPEFLKMFKIKADFDTDMLRTAETEQQMARFIATCLKRENGLPFDASGVAEVIDWSSRISDDQERISTEFNKITEVIVESSAWAKADGASLVTGRHVQKAVEEKKFRSNLIQERIARAYEDGVIRIDTSGEIVGQINGLSVVDLMDYRFGHPSRITANVYMGQEGVVNIEREVKLTGPIHNKGLLILTSYLGRKYAQDMPLSLSARITFEQMYGGIEGDSASSTELYCLLSALSGVPLKQGFAVTGSVDQFGNIQPIGGVNEKIEGFFQYCEHRGLTGEQGVIIPVQNVRHLMLEEKILEAVKDGMFGVFSVKTIDEGIELLTGVSPSTIHRKVKNRLKKWMKEGAKLKKKYKLEAEEDENDGEE
ncbi:putative ATP-dependent protease [Aminivibrio pyruvatiphilus]|uniref:endopeptidase La n=1 Tax=Aminivibrio pyruvatiphilus TaxID=1005740 RepID=A0A4R8MC44_9BACT|nr:ATP-binding protein [Aminivibrio pyruvatiphilus]TDY61767.1 putative ATP-dependent protease [Aminivibrio pyruvatiphilus]